MRSKQKKIAGADYVPNRKKLRERICSKIEKNCAGGLVLARFVSGGWYPGLVLPIAKQFQALAPRSADCRDSPSIAADCRRLPSVTLAGWAGQALAWLAGQAGSAVRWLAGWRLPVDAVRHALCRMPVDVMRYGTPYATRARARAVIGVALLA
jgi:hypothetical protein